MSTDNAPPGFEIVQIDMDDKDEKSSKQPFRLPERKKRTLTKEQKERASENLKKAREAKLNKLKQNASKMQEVQNERKAQLMKHREAKIKSMRREAVREVTRRRPRYEDDYDDYEDEDEYEDEYEYEEEPQPQRRRYDPGGRPRKGTAPRAPRGVIDEPPVVSGIPLDEYDDVEVERPKPKPRSKKSVKEQLKQEIREEINQDLDRLVKKKTKVKQQKEEVDPQIYQSGYRDPSGGSLSSDTKLLKKMISADPAVKDSLDKTMRVFNTWGCAQVV